MEIKMKQCPNGHVYNGSKHNVCPECGAAGEYISKPITPTITPVPPTTPVSPTAPVAPTNVVTEEKSPFGKTYAYDPNIAMPEEAETPEPIVGWLVCLNGVNRGKDYSIHSGYNYIGRETGDISIENDMYISREKHAMIAYDDEANGYYFGPAGGKNLVRVNGKLVMNAEEIHSYDVLSLGQSKLLFIGLCSDKFDWSKEY